MKTKFYSLFLLVILSLFMTATAWAENVSLQGSENTGYYVNLNAGATDDLTITSETVFKVYDDGGKDENYSSCGDCEEDGSERRFDQLVVTAPENYIIQVSGTVISEDDYDYLTIYDGTTSSTKLVERVGTENDGGYKIRPIQTSGNEITFEFSVDESEERAGLDLTVQVINPSHAYLVSVPSNITGGSLIDVSGATLVEGEYRATQGTNVSLTFTADENYALGRIDVVDDLGYNYEAIVGSGGNEIVVQFTMPYGDVTATPMFGTVHNVNIVSDDFGRVTSDLAAAASGATVTLTAVPGEESFLKEIVVVDEDDNPVQVTKRSENVVTFIMPDKAVTVTPVFRNPEVLVFDENGCLDNGTYFHLACSGTTCTLSQGKQTNPNVGVTDFKCWYLGTAGEEGEEVCEWDDEEETEVCQTVPPEKGVVDIIEESGYDGLTLKLGGPLNFGGYDGTTRKCVMDAFEPITLSSEIPTGVLDGQGNTVYGLCIDSDTRYSGGFVVGAQTINNIIFDNAHVVVNNSEGGSVVGIVTYELSSGNTSVTDVKIFNSYVAGTQVGAIAGHMYAEDGDGLVSVSTTSVTDTKIYALSTGTNVTSSDAGGFFGVMMGAPSVEFFKDTVKVSTTGAGFIANDASFTASNTYYRGGFAGRVNEETAVSVSTSMVRGLSVNTNGTNANVGGVFGNVGNLSMQNTRIENVSVSGLNAGGAAGSAYGCDFSFVTLSGTNTISGTANAGGLVGQVSASGTSAQPSLSFANLVVSANISGNSNMGGIAGSIEVSSELAPTMTVGDVELPDDMSFSAAGMPGVVNVGGLFGNISLSTMNVGSVTLHGIAIKGAVGFVNSDATQNTLYMGPLFGYASGAPFTIYGTYSVGDITYSGVDAANVNIGYLGGYYGMATEGTKIMGNYHFGSDAVASGLGNIAPATWKTGNDACRYNARNVAAGMLGEDDMGFYYYMVSAATGSYEAMDMFAADFSGGTYERVANGSVSEESMKSDLFAALLNYMPAQSGSLSSNIWTRVDDENENLPEFAANSVGKTIYLLPLAINDGDNVFLPSLTAEQRSGMGLGAIALAVDLDDNANVSTAYEGFVGYTNASGKANSAFVNSLNAARSTAESMNLSTSLQGEGLQTSVITENTIFTDGVETIMLTIDGLKTYDVAYEFCSGTATITCVSLENSGHTLLFTAPRPESITNGTEMYSTLIPNAIILDDNREVSWIVKYQDETGVAVGGEYTNSLKFGAFSDAIENAPEEASKIIVGFYDETTAPELIVTNPNSTGFDIYTYGYGEDGTEQLLSTDPVTVSTTTSSLGVNYGSSIAVRNVGGKTGYVSNSYSVEFKVSNPNEGRCNGIVSAGTEESDNQNIASWEELTSPLNNCTSKTWVLRNLSDDNLVGLKEIEIAKSKVQTDFWTDTLAVVPDFTPIEYTLSFDTTGWQYIKSAWGSLSISSVNYEIYVPRDFYGPAQYNLDNENLNLPQFHAVTQQYTNVNNRYRAFVSNWTYLNEDINCQVDIEGCVSRDDASGVFSADFISGATNAGKMGGTSESPAMVLHPVWTNGTTSRSFMFVDCDETDDYDCLENPITLELSQTFSMAGQTYTLKHRNEISFMGNTIPLPAGFGGIYDFDVNIIVNPGFSLDVDAVGFRDVNYNELISYENGVLTVDARGPDYLQLSPVIPEYTLVPYTVTFDLPSTEGEILVLASEWPSLSTKTMDIGKNNRDFPKLYRLDSDGYFYAYLWSTKPADQLEFEYSTDLTKYAFSRLTSAMLTTLPDENPEVTSFTAYPVNPTPYLNQETYTSIDYQTYSEIRIYAYDGTERLSDENAFHGHIVLSQSVGDLAITQESALTVENGDDEEIYFQRLLIPDIDQTFTFDFLLKPDPGYGVAFVKENGKAFIYEGDETVEDWGLNNDVLTIQPRNMNDMHFNVAFTQYSYYASFDRPDPELKVFVANKNADGVYQVDWIDAAENVTAETIHAPILYNTAGCRIGWKVRDREVESRETANILDELQYMAPAGGEVSAWNALEPDYDHPVCVDKEYQSGPRYELVLNVDEGDGDVVLVQKIGAEPETDDDPEQTVIEHEFEMADRTYIMRVPVAKDESGDEVGVTAMVVARPSAGYVLSELTYDMVVDGNPITILLQDSAIVNVKRNMTFHAKFESYAPVQVAYDLSLGAEDSSYVWIPADAVDEGSLALGDGGVATAMWMPYRSDKCFAGWSKLTAAEYAEAVANDEEVPVYNELSTDNYDEFSAVGLNKLYAIWKDYGAGCSRPTYNGTTYTSAFTIVNYEDPANLDDESLEQNDTLLVTQSFGDAVFMHKASGDDIKNPYNGQWSDDWKLGYNPAGYNVRIEVIPGAGYSVDSNAPETKVVAVSYEKNLMVANEELFHIGADSLVTNYETSIAKTKKQYNIVFASAAGETPVFYGENWMGAGTFSIGDPLPARAAFREGYCDQSMWYLQENSGEYDGSGVVLNVDLLTSIEKRTAAGLNADTLYVRWNADDSDCRLGYAALSLDASIADVATVILYQEVDGVEVKSLEIGPEGANVPIGLQSYGEGITSYEGDNIYFTRVEVKVKPGVTLADGYTVSYVKTADETQTAHALPMASGDAEVTFDENVKFVVQGLTKNVYTVAFDVNAGNANVFYPTDWESEGSYDIVENDGAAFPKAYRTDKCLVGYGFDKDASRDQSFDAFGSGFIAAYDSVKTATGTAPTTVYGVWNECAQTLYTVTLNEPVEGTLVLSQNGNTYNVPSTGMQVPYDGAGLEFGVSFIVNEGYEFDESGVFNEVDGTGNILAVLEDNVLVVNGNKIVDAPAAAKEFTFAFDVNVGEGVNVFYGDGWKESENYALATEATPLQTEVYRVGACLEGWTIGKESSTAFRQYDEAFVAAVENAKKAGIPTSVLYAKWGDCSSQTVVTVANADAAAGTFTLARTVAGLTTEYTVAGEALEVPADEPLAFAVSFASNKGYTYDDAVGISVADAVTNDPVTMEDDKLTVATSVKLIAAVSADVYTFALDENAVDANVFYTGELATTFSAKVTDDETTRTIPANLYRSDACLVGWNFSATATTGFKQLDEDFVAAYEAAGAEAPTTLYAVWNVDCHQTVYTVTSADTDKGELTLAQGNERNFAVGDGLEVPATESGIVFTVSFVPATGYGYDETAGFTATAQGGEPVVLEDDAVTVKQNMSIKALGLTDTEFAITFNLNAGNATVYYGNPSEGAAPTYIYKVESPADFPMDFYRTDACLTGWRTNAAPAEGDTLFNRFNAKFVEKIAEIPNYTGTLYAVWGTCPATNNVTVAQAAPEMGTLALVQKDVNGTVLSSTVVADEPVSFPLGNGKLEFSLEFIPNTGYSIIEDGFFYTVNAATGANISVLPTADLTLAGNTVLRAPAKVDSYEFAFNAGSSGVFYGSAWKNTGRYNMDMAESALAFPTAVYRVGYKLVGWSLQSEGGASFDAFEDALVESLDGQMSATLYAVWEPDAEQQVYTVSVYNAEAGVIELTQSVSGSQASFIVPSTGLQVPAVAGGLVFNASASLNSGYFANGNSLYQVTSEGSRLNPLTDGILFVDEDKFIEIPVESDGVQFVFAENTSARVFYADGWRNKGFFALNSETAFPMGILRTDAELLGWAISRNSTKYYTTYDAIVNDLRESHKLGLPTDTLYAVWMEYGTFENVILTAGNEKNGTFYISQTVDGVETAPIEVTASGVEIPRNTSGLSFNVKLDLNPGYYISSEEALKNSSGGEVVARAVNGGVMHLGAENSTLSADVAATRYKFVFDVNAAGMNVFYGDDWFSHEEKSLDDQIRELPHNIYRADARLVGWALDSTATEGVFDMSSEFVQPIDRNVATLYAVWEPANVETYRVSFANTNVGSLVLTQDVEDSTVSFDVSDTGLVVPVVAEGLHFRAAYTLNAGYAGSTDSLYRVDDLGAFISSLSSGELVVDQDVTLAIPTTGESYKVVFDVNNEKETLFYGDDWVNARTYMMTNDSASFPLPAYLYTANSCMVGWSLSKKDYERTYTEFSSDLVEGLQKLESKDSTYTLYAVWGEGSACDDAYNRISLQSANGVIKLVELATDSSELSVEHAFSKNNTMILPKVMNGNVLHVRSVPDSSYVLDSLVVLRLDGEERLATFEGGVLPSNLSEASLVAYFGKSNRTDIAFVNPKFAKTGNAVQFSFSTSEFEVTRGVSAQVILETIAGDVVANDILVDSLVPPYKGTWEKYPLAAGQYVLTATLTDGAKTVEYVKEFEVAAEIAAVSAEGWQMISIGNLDKDALEWDDDSKFYWWDESSAFGDFWQYKELSKDDEIDPTRGYWYSSLEGRSLVLKPDPSENVETVVWSLDSVNSGWNLVANPVGFALNVYGDRPAENVEATDKASITFWHWNAQMANYEEAVVLEPYEAVWAKVSAPTEWTVPVRPRYMTEDDSTEQETSASPLSKKAVLAKANGVGDWRLQMVLSDANGHLDSWNVLGVSRDPFSADEPPEGMGNHVRLAVLDGSRILAKSVKAPADEHEWTIALNASSERFGELSFKGVSDLNAYGLGVFVTIDGRTVEMREETPLRVALKSSVTQAVVRVASSAKVVAGAQIDALRALQSGNSLNVAFNVTEELDGHRTVVDLVNMDGRVISTRSLLAISGENRVALEVPKSGIYMLRVRAGSQIKAGRILVK